MIRKLSYIICTVLFIAACSTEKDAFVNRSYHYTTARFNGYFHGREALKLAQKNIAQNHEDDFEQILDVFQYGSEKINQGEITNLNRAVQKGAKMIDRHSMKFQKKKKKVEVNQMIDDCYLLIGKARFFKNDFESAAQTFKFIIKQFPEAKLRFDAQLWLVKTYIHQENFVDAETELQALSENQDLPKKLRDDLEATKAYYFIKSEQYSKAIEALEASIPLTKNRKFKRRQQFILAQLYQQAGNLNKASALYATVAKKATDYEMQFNAKISLAKTFEGENNANQVISVLEKMLKDAKNKDYLDQIYFALAQVYERQGNSEKAIENYKLAAQTSINNPKQKGKAFLALGDYYFEVPHYKNAKTYYDSALVFLPKDFKNLREIEDKNAGLVELVKHLDIVQREDSLQRIAAMGEAERTAYIDGLIQKVIQEEEKQALLKEAKLAELQAQALLQQNNNLWIFDNPSALATGAAEFKSIWGDRPLEDHWRRSDKTSVPIFSGGGTTEEAIDEEKIDPNKTQDFYTKDLPLSEEAIATSNEKVKNSLYKLGVLYRDDFNDLKESNYYFELLNKRFPKNDQELIAWYQLYRNYDKLQNPGQAGHYKSEILLHYPNSTYAELLRNPGALAQKEQTKLNTEKTYKYLFSAYKKDQLDSVITQTEAYNTSHPDNHLKANFDLLNAFATGAKFGKDSLIVHLQKVMSEYQGTNVANDVYVLLSKINKAQQAELKAAQEQTEKDKQFEISNKQDHFACVIVDNNLVDIEKLKADIADFNQKFFGDLVLEVKTMDWDKGETIILIKTLKDPKKYSAYLTGLKGMVLNNYKTSDYVFVISSNNFGKLFKYKDALMYMKFYQENYQ